MIDNQQEYRRMFEVEQKLWWYQLLHGKVLKEIHRNFKKPETDLRVLDAACGTGGLLSRLQGNGFRHLTGFDYSPYAVSFSRERGLDVEGGDLRKTDRFRPGSTYDVICCNDALYFLSDAEIVQALSEFGRRLNPGGIILINIHAFDAFAGTHDLAVGSTRRFKLAHFKKYAEAAGLIITQNTYWPFFLSLPIYLVRSWQRFQLRRGAYRSEKPDSDVGYPGDVVNLLLKSLVRLEERLLPSAPFGSSLFMVMRTRFKAHL